MASAIQVRVDDELITNANSYEVLREQEILDKLEKSREHAAHGMYKTAIEVSYDMRAKYGL